MWGKKGQTILEPNFSPVKVNGVNSIKVQQRLNFLACSLLYIAYQELYKHLCRLCFVSVPLETAQVSLHSLAFVEDASRICSLPCPGNIAQILIWKLVKLHAWNKVGDFGMPVFYFTVYLKC